MGSSVDVACAVVGTMAVGGVAVSPELGIAGVAVVDVDASAHPAMGHSSLVPPRHRVSRS